MKRILGTLGVVVLWATSAWEAPAAWDNVYQPTLFGRRRQQQTTAQYYVAPAVVYSSPVVTALAPCQPCQQPCSTSYTQRCFYQPVTTYQTQTYYEPVTTTQVSYYYEPVTTYRTSFYFDPCSCSYYQQSTPVVSYELRARSCPVQSWVARCVQVPVTTYQKACYWEPRTTCCQTTTGPLIPVNGAAPPLPNPPSVTASPVQPAYPQTPPPPMIKENVSPPPGPNVGNTSFSNPPATQWQPGPMPPAGHPAPSSSAPPPVTLDRIAYGPESYIEGQVVRHDQSPRPNASLLFVHAQTGQRETVTANGAGRFQTKLASGNWLVYVAASDGTPQFYSQFTVPAHQTARITVVN